MSKKIEGIFLTRIKGSTRPDLCCDECFQQFQVGVKPEVGGDWPSYMVAEESHISFDHVNVVCPELVKIVVEHHGRIVCPACNKGVLIIDEESRFDPESLIFWLKHA